MTVYKKPWIFFQFFFKDKIDIYRYMFKVYDMMIWWMYELQNDYYNKVG